MEILQIIKNIWPYMWTSSANNGLRFLFSFICALCANGLMLVSPLILKELVNTLALLSEEKPSSYIILLVVAYGGAWTAGEALNHLRTIFSRKAIHASFNSLILNLYNHLNKLPMSYHYNRSLGEITSIVDRSESSFYQFFDGLFWQVLPLFLSITCTCFLIIHICGFSFGAVLFVILLTYLLSLVFGVSKAEEYQKKSNEKHAEVSSYLVDTLLNFETIRMFNKEQYEGVQLSERLKEREITEHNANIRMEGMTALQLVILGVGLTILTAMSAHEIALGRFTIGDFVLINTYLLQFSLPMSYFGYVTQGIRRALTSLEEVTQILRIPLNKELSTEKEISKFRKGAIEFKGVGYRYDKERPILTDISFLIPEGKKVGIVGTTGGGKSTIAKLLLGLFPPTQGDIYVDNVSLSQLENRTLRENIAVVPQDIILFNNSLRYNVTYGARDITEEDLQEALTLFHLNQLVDALPGGLDTLVGERGIKISGGEKQRIALARAFLRKPFIYIFDEATSSLDLETEKSILEDIAATTSGKTTLMISHRLSPIVSCDEIIVLSNGHIIERGTHKSLLQLGGLYQSLWEQQTTH